MNNNGLLKAMLAGLLILYVVSPMDMAPGPMDDLLLILFSAVMNSKGRTPERALPPDRTEEVRHG